MCIIDKYLRRAVIRDFFESSRHSRDTRHRLHDRLDIDFLGDEYRRRCEDVHDIELSLEWGIYMEGIRWHTYIEAHSVRSVLHVLSS